MQEKLVIKKISLTRLSDTRWNWRVKNCIAVKFNLNAIITVLNNEIDNSNNKNVLQAVGKAVRVLNKCIIQLYYFIYQMLICIFIKLCFIGILAIINKPSFVVHLLILVQVLQIINILSRYSVSK